MIEEDLIEPCPFCGNPDVIQRINKTTGSFSCRNCNALVRFPNDASQARASWEARFFGMDKCRRGDELWLSWHKYNAQCKQEDILERYKRWHENEMQLMLEEQDSNYGK